VQNDKNGIKELVLMRVSMCLSSIEFFVKQLLTNDMALMNDPLHSSFRIDGKINRQVNRDLSAGGQGHNGAQHVRVNVLETAFTPTGKILPA